MTHELRRRGILANHKRIARIVHEQALTPRRVRRFMATTDSDHDEPIYPNLAKGSTPTGPDQLWVADIAYIRLRAGFAFLAVILNAWSRRVVGYGLGQTISAQLTLAALDAAITSRRPAHGLVHIPTGDRSTQPEPIATVSLSSGSWARWALGPTLMTTPRRSRS